MGFQIPFWISLSHFLWLYFRNESLDYMVPLFWNFEELLHQYIFLKPHPEVRAIWPFPYLYSIASKYYYSSKFLFLLEKNGAWLYHSILHILPLHPRCQTSSSSPLCTFVDDLGTWRAVFSPFLSPTVVLRGQYPEDYPIPWLSQTSGFHSDHKSLSFYLSLLSCVLLRLWDSLCCLCLPSHTQQSFPVFLFICSSCLA